LSVFIAAWLLHQVAADTGPLPRMWQVSG